MIGCVVDGKGNKKPASVVSYRAIKKVAPKLEIDPGKSWQFLVLACDGLFDVMTNQQGISLCSPSLFSNITTKMSSDAKYSC
jgi:serine/threonine protein phosphatase PrpC